MVTYDPAVIRAFAQDLYDRASTIVAVNTVIGVIVGGIVGKFAFGNLGVIILAGLGGAIGYFIGSQKAFQLKLQAQTALCQVEIEHNTRNSSSSLAISEAINISKSAIMNGNPMVADPKLSPQKIYDSGQCPECGDGIDKNLERCPGCSALLVEYVN